MLKNMPRRGLAWGAIVALFTSAFVGVLPAKAAAGITTLPFYGSTTDYTAVQGVGFALKSNLGAAAVNSSELKYWVEIITPDITFAHIDNDSGSAGSVSATGKVGYDLTSMASVTFEDVGSLTSADPTATDRSFIIDPTDPTDTTNATHTLKLDVSGFDNPNTTATLSDSIQLRVTAFIDYDGDNTPDVDGSGTVKSELVSDARTITFVNPATVSLTPSFDYAVIGDDTISGTVTANVNTEMLWNLDDMANKLTVTVNTDATASPVSLGDAYTVTLASAGGTLASSSALATFSATLPSATAAVAILGKDVVFEKVSVSSDSTPVTVADLAATASSTTSATVMKFTALESALLVDGDAPGNWSISAVAGYDFVRAGGDYAPTIAYSSVKGAITFTYGTAAILLMNGGNSQGDLLAGSYSAQVKVAGKVPGATTIASSTYFAYSSGKGYAETVLADKGIATGTASPEILLGLSSTVIKSNELTGTTYDYTAIEGTKTFTFTMVGYTNASKSANVGAGVNARITLTDVSNDLGDTTLTAGGETLTSTGVNSVAFDVKSDVNGVWTWTVTADEGNDGESFKVSAAISGVTADGKMDKTIEWQEAVPTILAPSNVSIPLGGSFTAEYVVTDQFSRALTGDYQLVVTRARASGDRTTAAEQANFAYTAAVTDGMASVAIADNGSTTKGGVDTITATLQKKATAGNTFVNDADASTKAFSLTYSTKFTGATLEAKVNNNGLKAGAVTVTPIGLESETLVAYDTRIGGTAPSYNNNITVPSAGVVTITGTVKDSAGVGIAGAPVLVSAPGLLLGYGSEYRIGSAQPRTSADGSYTLTVRGNLSGKQTVTVTAAGKSESIDLTFATGSVAATNMVITAPATSDAGKVIDVVVKVTDKDGRAAAGVDVTFKSKGAGYLNALSGTSDADGEVIVKLITLTNDSGTATITATATLAGVSTAKVATVTVGAAAASSDQKVNAGSFKGYVALYAKGYAGQRMSAKVGADWVVVESLASDFERVVEFTGAGYTISVPIYIDRVLVDTIVVTTK